MEKVTTTKRLVIVKQYLSGLSYDEIATKNGVSKGTVANVIADLKEGRFPEVADVREHIELLRELSLDLKRSKLTPGQCATGLILLTRINECGLDPADIDRWPMILKSAGNEDEIQEFIRVVYNIQEVQQRTGLSLDALDNKAHELERKAADLEPMVKKREECKKQLVDLNKRRGELASSVAGLEEKYKLFNPRVKDLEKREQDLSRRIKNMEPKVQKAEATLTGLNRELQRLQDTGLPFEELTEFSQKIQAFAQRHNITPVDLRDRLLQELGNLDQTLGLEVLILGRQQELDRHEQSLNKTKEELETVKAVVSSLKREKTSLEASIKNTREKVSKEIAQITPVAKDTVNRLVEELRRGHEEALADVHRLKDEALKVGKEIGRYEEILQVNEWLNELVALVRGEENLESKRVRVIVLLVLRGAAAWLKHNEADNLRFSPLLSTTENLIRELEQWKV